MKKNKLYTANQWNQPLFADVDREYQNVFDGLSGSYLGNMERDALQTLRNNPLFQDIVDAGGTEEYLNSTGNNWFGISKANNPFSKVNIGSTVKAAAPAVASALGALGNSALSDGLSSAAGTAISGLGSTIGGAIGTVNPVAGAAVSLGSQLLGGLTNRAFGSKLNEANIAKVNQDIANTRQSAAGLSAATDTDTFMDAAGNLDMGNNFSNGFIGKDGWFSTKARRKAEELREKQAAARSYAIHALGTGAENVDQLQDDLVASTFTYGEGGPLETVNTMGIMGNMRNMGIDGSSDTFFANGGGIEIKHPGRLTELKKRTGKTEAELWAEGRPEVRKMIQFARSARKWNKAYGGYLDAVDKLNAVTGQNGLIGVNGVNDTLFALGGDLQTHGSDYSIGQVYNVSEEEADHLKTLGYEFKVIE